MKPLRLHLILIALVAIAFPCHGETGGGPVLWYDKPAGDFIEALPIGNGRLGAMVYGGLNHDTLGLNHDRLWRRKYVNTLEPVWPRLDSLRTLADTGKWQEADRFFNRTFNPRYTLWNGSPAEKGDINPYIAAGDVVFEFATVKGGIYAIAPQKMASILDSLPDASYPIEVTGTGKAQLTGGVFEEPVAPGSASRTRIRLGKEQASGDLNGDGAEDAAVVLTVESGGSGTFIYLAAVIDDNGNAKPVATVLLGDRIIMKSLAITPGGIVATMLTRSPNKPMSAAPTIEVHRTFALRGGRLVEAK